MSGKTDATIPQWLQEAITLEKEGKYNTAVDMLFKEVNDLLVGGDFAQVNELLQINPEQLPINILIGIATVTLAANHKLSNRGMFMLQTEEHVLALYPAQGQAMLQGL